MAQKPYMPDTDEGIAQMLAAFDDNDDPFAGKYNILSAEILRVRQARMCWRYMLDEVALAKDWAQSVVEKKDTMRDGPVGPAQAMPVGPMIPAVPTIDLGTGLQPIKWEPGFFVFFANLVTRIKVQPNYDPADGVLLAIEGAEIPPPATSIVPPLEVSIGTGGFPQLEVPKGQFDGFDFWFQIDAGAEQAGTFSTKRRYIHQLPLPPAGQSILVTYRAQYRYKGAPFGQKSLPVSVSVRG